MLEAHGVWWRTLDTLDLLGRELELQDHFLLQCAVCDETATEVRNLGPPGTRQDVQVSGLGSRSRVTMSLPEELHTVSWRLRVATLLEEDRDCENVEWTEESVHNSPC